ncbi:MAG: hypothetical protein ACI86C_001556 [Candidatus Latescibacterota bacterium]|jgi:hypothetical protein
MRRIRELYFQDSTVTIVLLSGCAHSMRYIDWEIKSSLRRGIYAPNGLIGIVLPTRNNSAHLPDRLELNWSENHANCYARYWSYPSSLQRISQWVEDVHQARISRAHLIKNEKSMVKYNSKCKFFGAAH